ncbi:hypothetical protein [Vibrio owensii]|uniref:hypothetical protein n=1 Tax=Vibrio owensii TaxID=696485 RepID=UPI003CC6B5F8
MMRVTVDLLNGDAIPEGKAKQWALDLIESVQKSSKHEWIEITIGCEYMVTAITYAMTKLKASDSLVVFVHEGEEISVKDGYPQRPTWENLISKIDLKLLTAFQ